MALDRRWLLGAGIFAMHFALQIGTLLGAFSLGMGRFGTGEPAGNAETVLAAASGILTFPIVWGMGVLPKSFHNAVSGLGIAGTILGYVPFVLNSAIWGMIAQHAYGQLKKRK